jgi:hypothetical protein
MRGAKMREGEYISVKDCAGTTNGIAAIRSGSTQAMIRGRKMSLARMQSKRISTTVNGKDAHGT